MGTCKAAVAFFQAEYIVVGAALLEKLDLLADEFKSCQNFNEFHLITVSDGTRHVGGNNGRNQCRILGHLACGCPLS